MTEEPFEVARTLKTLFEGKTILVYFKSKEYK